MRNDDLVRLTSIEEVAEYIINASDKYVDKDECVAVVLRREDALECFNILVSEYYLDVLLATVNPDDEDLFYEITIGLGVVSIEPICNSYGDHIDRYVDYMLVDGDVPNSWVMSQSCDNYEMLTFEDECDCCSYYEVKFEIPDELFTLLDSDGELTRLLKIFGTL